MMFFYNYLVLPIALSFLFLSKFFVKKIAQGLEVRKRLFDKLQKKLDSYEASSPRMLVHSTSVGEWLQAEPIVAELKKRYPQLVIIASFFSPSGYNFVGEHHKLIDVKTYLPLDTKKNAKKFFAIVQPKLWVISKLDVWANHLWQAKKSGVKVFLSCATLTELSKRDKGLSGLFHRNLYRHIDTMFPISQADKLRLDKLYSGKMVVCGDTKYDLVVSAARKGFCTPLSYSEGDVVFIAGSIWSQGAKVLFPALQKVLQNFPNFKLILAPHDLRFVPQFLAEFDGSVPYSTVKKGDSPKVVVVDSIGQLAGLYRFADIAYVGGGFANHGLHNVVEAAVFAPLLLIGEHYHSSHEAEQMVVEGVATVIRDSQQVGELLDDFLCNRQNFASQRKACGEFVRKNQGATAKIVAEILAEVGDKHKKKSSY